MTTRNPSIATLAVLLAAVVGLAACGGGGGDSPPPPAVTDAIPDSASQTLDGMTGYLSALTAAEADDKEPLALDRFAPQQSETDEPRALN
jgi:hypothetical protein